MVDEEPQHPIDIAEDEVQRAIYEHATEEEWYRGPRETSNDSGLDDDVEAGGEGEEFDLFNF